MCGCQFQVVQQKKKNAHVCYRNTAKADVGNANSEFVWCEFRDPFYCHSNLVSVGTV